MPQDKITKVASELGFTNDKFLVRTRSCPQVVSLPGTCIAHLFFITELSVDAFRKQVDLHFLPPQRRGILAGQVFGVQLFDRINSNSSHQLTVNGISDFTTPLLEQITGNEWSRADGEQTIVVSYWTTPNGISIEFDGKPLKGNVVDVNITQS